MGIGPDIISLYHQLRVLGAFDGVKNVMELGSQGVWCDNRALLASLFQTFDKSPPYGPDFDIYINDDGTGRAPSREFHERLGFHYDCVDIDEKFGSIMLDFNFDDVPEKHRGLYDLVTNHGTTEHLLNQYNVFKVIHEFTAPKGLMLHAVPFTVHLDHGFFNYQPNFFEALARYNSYRVLGVWIRPDWKIPTLVPWRAEMLDLLTFNSKTTHVLLVVHQKMHDAPFQVPIQGVYEEMLPETAKSRYNIVVDGDVYSRSRLQHLNAVRAGTAKVGIAAATPMSEVRTKDVGREFLRRVAWRLSGGRINLQ